MARAVPPFRLEFLLDAERRPGRGDARLSATRAPDGAPCGLRPTVACGAASTYVACGDEVYSWGGNHVGQLGRVLLGPMAAEMLSFIIAQSESTSPGRLVSRPCRCASAAKMDAHSSKSIRAAFKNSAWPGSSPRKSPKSGETAIMLTQLDKYDQRYAMTKRKLYLARLARLSSQAAILVGATARSCSL